MIISNDSLKLDCDVSLSVDNNRYTININIPSKEIDKYWDWINTNSSSRQKLVSIVIPKVYLGENETIIVQE